MLFDFVNQQPVRGEMALPVTFVITRQSMVFVLGREGLFAGQHRQHVFQKLWVIAAFDDGFVIFFKTNLL